MNTSQAIEKLDRYIRARYPVIVVLTHEEKRALDAIRGIALARNKNVYTWSLTDGLTGPDNRFDAESTRDLIAAFEQITASAANPVASLFVFRDAHGLVGDPVTVRYLRDVALAFEQSRHNLILLSPAFQIPFELEKTAAVLDWPLPDTDELERIVERVEGEIEDRISVRLNGGRETVVQAMRGLTAFEAESCLLSAIAATRELSEAVIPHIVKEKQQIIKKSGVLEFFDTDVTMSEVGGLPYIKRYAEITRKTFSAKAREKNVDPAKGVLLVGIPGTGKSLSAKAIAGGKMPLLRMDVGALMSSLVGGSESNTRLALKTAEAVAPAVLWLDEVEKGLSGVESSGRSDGGTTARVFGTILTWMQETTAPVYIVATANDVQSLKPEFLRRFDDIFFVDLPNQADRMEILAVHLNKRHIEAAIDMIKISEACWGMTGAEIEKVVKTAVRQAFYEERELTTADLIKAAGETIPICVTMKEQIDNLRGWAKNRAKLAAEPLEPKPTTEQISRTLDL